METVKRTYLPAAGHDWALPLYDPLLKLLGAERAQAALLEQAGLQTASRILDIGCGTGTVAVRLKREHPGIAVTGLDPDPKALDRAAEKARRARVAIRFDRGFADELPYDDGAFDRVLSSFMFHHLKPQQREQTLREALRVLAPGGSLHLLDFEHDEPSRGGLMARLHANHVLGDNSESRILALMRSAGFTSAKKMQTRLMLFGVFRIGCYAAS